LDNSNRVLYFGTLSKMLFPALRLGYIVLPPDLVEPFYKTRSLFGGTPPLLEQVTTARFISDGHFERHIRRTRSLYAERQEILLESIAADRLLADLLQVSASEAGMHLVAWLPDAI